MIRDDATQAQVDAAQPGLSTWLSANAGSGKTRVLTDRVARLLLEGVDPQHVLCLTYTKAAASEMQNRLFTRLGEWAMLGNDDLRMALDELGIDSAVALRSARRLFARAIETPGGLKIQTIHSFCSGLLRRFPMEAGISPQFTEMDEQASAQLRAQVVEKMAQSPDDAQRLDDLAAHVTAQTLDDLTGEIVKHRAALHAPPEADALAQMFGLKPGVTEQDVVDSVFLGGEAEILTTLIPALMASGTNDVKAAKKLGNIKVLDGPALPCLEGVFLTGKDAKSPFSAKIGSFPTKKCREGLADIAPQLEAWMLRVEDARQLRLALAGAQKTRALHRFAARFLAVYASEKQLRGMLDFDDLILHARDLLTDQRVADWVLFRLDGGIDHILVDEAQDTSPVQWQVIERLAQEFTSGQGTQPEKARTIFVVGDKKQSIYSFQGADPQEFDRMRDDFAARLQAIDAPLQKRVLEFSFRSSQAILSVVDHTFKGAEASGFAPDQNHKAFKSHLPGRVDLWPLVEKPDDLTPPAWFDPVDIQAANAPAVVLAQRVADQISAMIKGNTAIPDDKVQGGFRAVEPGDFLILVQRRNALFHEIIRKCKALELPIAGSDRLKVGAELAVRDLRALLSFMALPEDNLSLAEALKSPLFGWDEAALYDLAQGRAQKYLWAELRDRAEEFPETHAVLRDLRNCVGLLRPYELIERILTRHGGRKNLLARLGPEAEDGIDALLAQAMAYERRAVDSLTGFLVWMNTDDLEIKRQMDSAGNRIRVMTVHGAKGLEAPIVILPDSGKREIRLRNELVPQGETVLWKTVADERPEVLIQANERLRAAEKAERDRLLYVAMTRAEKWLIVAAAGELDSKGESWFEMVRQGMQGAGAQAALFAGGKGQRVQFGDWPASADKVDQTARGEAPVLGAFFRDPAPAVSARAATLSPSDLGGAKALAGERGLDEEAAKRRGRQIHRLLEHLPDVPASDWPATAARLLLRGPDAATGEELALLLAEATKVLNGPALSPIFGPDALAEVPLTADLPALQGARIHGIIDRLLVREDHVLAVDFKTNAMVPERAEDVPDGLLRQMGAYAQALQQIYPDLPVRTAILWTRTATLMLLPHDIVMSALETTQDLDGAGTAT